MEKQAFIEKVNSIGSLLGYSVELSTTAVYNKAVFRRDDALIGIRHGDYMTDDRFRIWAIYPKSDNGYNRYGEKSIEITVDQNKSAAQIAGDIQRRLIPKYLPELEFSAQWVNRQNEYIKTRTANIQLIAEYAHTRPGSRTGRPEDGVVFFGGEHNCSHKIELYNEKSFRVTLDGVTVEQAKQIIDIMRKDQQ